MTIKKWKYFAFLAWASAGAVWAVSEFLPNQEIVKAEVSSDNFEVDQARAAAHAGMSHFISHHLSNNEIESGILVPETDYGVESAYEVETTWNDAGQIVVMSRGRYLGADSGVLEYPIRAVFTPEPSTKE